MPADAGRQDRFQFFPFPVVRKSLEIKLTTEIFKEGISKLDKFRNQSTYNHACYQPIRKV